MRKSQALEHWETLAAFGLALVVRLIRLDHTPQWDEFYHVLAARSWIADGTLSIADGQYPRAPIFTWIVSWFIDPAQDSFVTARLPAVVAGSLLVALLFHWTGQLAGRRAGWIAAILLCFNPLSIYLSQLVRFYTMHALCFMVGAWAIYQLVDRELSMRLRLLAGLVASLALALALHFQLSTLGGFVGLAIWLALQLSPRCTQRLLSSPQRAWLIGLSAALLLAAVATVVWSGVLDNLVHTYRWTPFWGEQTVNDRRYYDRWFTRELPALWTTFPIGVLIALRRYRKFTFFCLTVFAFAFLLHSFAGAKAPRFIYYTIPFFFAIWGIALSEASADILRLIRHAISPILVTNARRIAAKAAVWISLAGLVLFFLVTNLAFRHAALMLVLPDAEWPYPQQYRGFADWAAAQDTLRPLTEDASVVISSAGVKSLYYLQRLDFDMSATVLFGTTGREFGIDPRTGRPVISRPESLQTIMKQHPTGVVIVETSRWRRDWNVPDAIADYLEARTERVPLPEKWRLMVFKWERPEPPKPEP